MAFFLAILGVMVEWVRDGKCIRRILARMYQDSRDVFDGQSESTALHQVIFPMHTRKFVKFSVPPDRRERWPEMGSERVLRGESDMMMRN